MRAPRPYLLFLQESDPKLRGKAGDCNQRDLTEGSLDTALSQRSSQTRGRPRAARGAAAGGCGAESTKENPKESSPRDAERRAYICLYHLAALRPDSADEAVNVHLPLGVHHVQHGIDDDESARASHPGAEKAEGTRNKSLQQRRKPRAGARSCPKTSKLGLGGGRSFYPLPSHPPRHEGELYFGAWC